VATTDGIEKASDGTRRHDESGGGIDLIGTSSEVSNCRRRGLGEKRTAATDFDVVVAVDSARSGGGR